MPAGTPYNQRFLLAGVEVNEVAGGGTVVCIGDSITDGAYVPPDSNLRWPDDLSNRLQASGLTSLSVVDMGIGGGRVLLYGAGPSLLSRFNREALTIPGVKYIILFEGVNDIGLGATAASLEAAYPQLVAQAHALGIKVFGATITPFYPHSYYTPATEAVRQQVNAFIRTSGTFDAVLDFDAAIRDPAAPYQLLAAYDSGDHIHPSLAGLQALANAVNLELLTH
jgi:lysophospholipase L1-like esterase